MVLPWDAQSRPIICNLYMEDFERQELESAQKVTTYTVSNKEVNISTRTERAPAFLDTWWLMRMVQLRPKCTVRRPIRSNDPLQHKRGVEHYSE